MPVRVTTIAAAAVPAWAALANAAVDDPTRALRAVTGLQGAYYGRYAMGRRATLQPATATVASVLADSIAQRTAVQTATAALLIAATSLTTGTAGARRAIGARTAPFATAAQAVAGAVLASAADPADAIRLLLPLATWIEPPIPGYGPLAQSATIARAAIASNLRCAALAALAQASAAYQPVSFQDAQAVRALVCNALDAEATRAGDSGVRDATFAALRATRAAVALDLAVRGANLAALVEVTTIAPMPSLAAAWWLYQDTTREPQLVASADPPHPMFLPLSFPALDR
jgi:prophage DNA circulation protein